MLVVFCALRQHQTKILVWQQQEGRRDAVIRCLIHFLGESCEELIKDYQDISKDMIKDSFADLVMKIIVLASAAAEEGATPDHCY
ncbi:hypothetical protein SRHO_G00070920 [Serrasalmus rhombeus]